MIRAALLHAVYQPRVSGMDQAGAQRDALRALCGADVEELLHAYQSAGLPGAAPAPLAAGCNALQRQVRILQLADQLEDGLDGGPWWHGEAGDADVRGSARERLDQFLSLSAAFAQAPALGVPVLLARWQALAAGLQQGRWPEALRTGKYSSFRAE